MEVFTLHRCNNAIEYCYNLSVSVSVFMSGSVNTPLPRLYPGADLGFSRRRLNQRGRGVSALSYYFPKNYQTRKHSTMMLTACSSTVIGGGLSVTETSWTETPPGQRPPWIETPPPLPRGQTNTCENITLSQISFAGGKNWSDWVLSKILPCSSATGYRPVFLKVFLKLYFQTQ